jgi:hypothetical protein
MAGTGTLTKTMMMKKKTRIIDLQRLGPDMSDVGRMVSRLFGKNTIPREPSSCLLFIQLP